MITVQKRSASDNIKMNSSWKEKKAHEKKNKFMKRNA